MFSFTTCSFFKSLIHLEIVWCKLWDLVQFYHFVNDYPVVPTLLIKRLLLSVISDGTENLHQDSGLYYSKTLLSDYSCANTYTF